MRAPKNHKNGAFSLVLWQFAWVTSPGKAWAIIGKCNSFGPSHLNLSSARHENFEVIVKTKEVHWCWVLNLKLSCWLRKSLTLSRSPNPFLLLRWPFSNIFHCASYSTDQFGRFTIPEHRRDFWQSDSRERQGLYIKTCSYPLAENRMVITGNRRQILGLRQYPSMRKYRSSEMSRFKDVNSSPSRKMPCLTVFPWDVSCRGFDIEEWLLIVKHKPNRITRVSTICPNEMPCIRQFAANVLCNEWKAVFYLDSILLTRENLSFGLEHSWGMFSFEMATLFMRPICGRG
jgi:hypothetical protein